MPQEAGARFDLSEFCLLNVSLFARIGLLVALLLSSAQTIADNHRVVHLRTPPAIAHGDYLRDLLTAAYAKIGYRVEYLDVPGVREATLTQRSELSAMLARDEVIELSYPDLTRVSEPLFSYDVLLIGDRRQCNYCDVQQIKDLVYPRGGKIYEQVIKTLPDSISKTAVIGTKSVESLLVKQRVDAALISNMGITDKVRNNPHFIIKTLETRFDYHYLAPKYAHLAKPLAVALKRMAESGEMATLKSKHSIVESKPIRPELPERVLAVTGTWKNYAESDNKGTYWQLLSQVFDDETQLTTDSSTWLRSVRLFELGKADILVGAYQNEPSGYLHSTYHIDYEYEVIAVAKDKQTLADFIDGKKPFQVCAPQAYELALSKLNPVNKLHSSNVTSCIDMFQRDRVDIVLQYPYNLVSLTVDLPWQTLYKPAPLFLMFQNSAAGQALQAHCDRRVADMAREKQIRPLFPSQDDFARAKIDNVN